MWSGLVFLIAAVHLRHAALGRTRCVAFGLCLLALAAEPALAQEPVLARVLSIAADRVTLAVPGSAVDAVATRVSVAIDRADLPPDLAPGRLVRLWPGATPDATGLSAGARLVPLERGASVPDRTGVRSRLMHGAARGAGGGRGGR